MLIHHDQCISTHPEHPTIFGTNQTCLRTPRFVQILPNMQYFPNHWWLQIFFFTSAIGPDILIKVVTFLVWAACVLFNFYIKQKQKFSVWSFTENATFISFHEGICSVTKAHWKKCRSRLGNFKHNKVVCFTGYSL